MNLQQWSLIEVSNLEMTVRHRRTQLVQALDELEDRTVFILHTTTDNAIKYMSKQAYNSISQRLLENYVDFYRLTIQAYNLIQNQLITAGFNPLPPTNILNPNLRWQKDILSFVPERHFLLYNLDNNT